MITQERFKQVEWRKSIIHGIIAHPRKESQWLHWFKKSQWSRLTRLVHPPPIFHLSCLSFNRNHPRRWKGWKGGKLHDKKGKEPVLYIRNLFWESAGNFLSLWISGRVCISWDGKEEIKFTRNIYRCIYVYWGPVLGILNCSFASSLTLSTLYSALAVWRWFYSLPMRYNTKVDIRLEDKFGITFKYYLTKC